MKYISKNPVRIDMTPMVDMGFLLLLSFIMIHLCQKPQVTELKIPSHPDSCCECESNIKYKILTINLLENNKLLYYRGTQEPLIDSIDFSNPKNLRPVLQNIRAKIIEKWGNDGLFFTKIKVSPATKYANFVNLIDEMKINQISNYYLDTYTTEDSLLMWEARR